MADITVTPWGFNQFEGMNNNWITKVCAQALEYREDESFTTLADAMRELRKVGTILKVRRNDIEFEAYGNTYYLCTEDMYEQHCDDAITMQVEYAESELQSRLKDCSWLQTYIEINIEMMSRDLSYDKDDLICTYDGRVDELSVAWIREDGKVHRSDHTWYLWRID